ncbi:putative 40S ribosomal protein S3-1-like [Capsicum annuum]|nr:putative 40S ribosomal protein S3-1-like [Capsicum annuum]KAF3675556.1 putative 40S ribosomal protein S3-1-like [Capsicum annuum]
MLFFDRFKGSDDKYERKLRPTDLSFLKDVLPECLMFGSYGFEGDMDSKEWFYSLATCGRPLNDTMMNTLDENPTSTNTAKILPVVKNQHLLLCTLLIGNSLAIEIIPQVICTHYGLTIGATVAPLVQLLLWLFFLIAYPISKAEKGGDLTHDETTIITGALESMEKTAKDAMTPISKAFSLDLDGTLNLSFMLSGTIHDLVLLTGRISPWYICSQDCLEIQ